MTTSKQRPVLEVLKNRLAGGRCACQEPTVKWCAKHGEPMKTPYYRHWTVRASS